MGKQSDVLLVLGDGESMPKDLEAFLSWGVKHDVGALGRGIKTYPGYVRHWFSVRADGVAAGRISLVDFTDPTKLVREEAGRFRASAGATPKPAGQSTVRGGAIEQSNVSLVERIAHMTEVSRSFQALQRGLSVMLNDIDGRAISEFGKR